jgi:gamma-glutamylcyclotransferase (GGCT)/AIG2-like uncharacterized protein YtfP
MVMMSQAERLFVYGTLRPCLVDRAPESPRQLVRALPYLGVATVCGRIFDLGAYPGFTFSEATAPTVDAEACMPRIVGDVLEVQAAELAVFDAYEECDGPAPLYRRERVQANWQASSEPVECWIYVYAGDPSHAVPIPEGDYAAYLARCHEGPRMASSSETKPAQDPKPL